MRPSVIWWGRCACYTWPLVAGWQVRRCGLCNELPRPCDAPPSGRAEPLEGTDARSL